MRPVTNIHYIYINRYDKFDTKIPDYVLELKDLYTKKPDTQINFYTYTDLYNEINSYNTEYGFLFSKINPMIAAALSDIGRIFLLWKYGGIYHDLNEYINDGDVLQDIVEKLSRLEFLFMNKPSTGHKCANSNMASVKNIPMFKQILATQFKNINRVREELFNDPSKVHNMWTETTMVYLYELILASGVELPGEGTIPYEYNHIKDQYIYSKSGVRFHRDSATKFREHFIDWKMKLKANPYNRNPDSGLFEHWSQLQKKVPLVL